MTYRRIRTARSAANGTGGQSELQVKPFTKEIYHSSSPSNICRIATRLRPRFARLVTALAFREAQ